MRQLPFVFRVKDRARVVHEEKAGYEGEQMVRATQLNLNNYENKKFKLL